MKVTIQDNKIVIEMDLEAEPQLSSTKRNFLIATTHGVIATDCKHNGKVVKLSVNAMVSAR